MDVQDSKMIYTRCDPPLKNGCDDNWVWSQTEKSPEVKLQGNGLRTALFHPNWSSGTAGVRGHKALVNGRYYWEVHLTKRVFGTSMMFGICTKYQRLHTDSFTNLLGEDFQGWGLSHKGLIWHGGRWYHYTKPFRENEATTVGILYDSVTGTLTFYKDGECLGVAFKGLNGIKEPLYPFVCSTAAKTEMTLMNMKRDFVSLQDRCRACILKRVKNKEDLEYLMVPDKIRQYLLESMGGVESFIPVVDDIPVDCFL